MRFLYLEPVTILGYRAGFLKSGSCISKAPIRLEGHKSFKPLLRGCADYDYASGNRRATQAASVIILK